MSKYHLRATPGKEREFEELYAKWLEAKREVLRTRTQATLARRNQRLIEQQLAQVTQAARGRTHEDQTCFRRDDGPDGQRHHRT